MESRFLGDKTGVIIRAQTNDKARCLLTKQRAFAYQAAPKNEWRRWEDWEEPSAYAKSYLFHVLYRGCQHALLAQLG